MKICSRCKIEKSVSEFYKDKSIKDGLNNKCKMCASEKNKRWRKANPEKKRELNKKWNEANPEKVRESRKKWKEANPEKIREHDKKWKEANPEKIRESKKIHYAINKQSGL